MLMNAYDDVGLDGLDMISFLTADELIFRQQFLQSLSPVSLLLQGNPHEFQSSIVFHPAIEEANATALLAHHTLLHFL